MNHQKQPAQTRRAALRRGLGRAFAGPDGPGRAAWLALGLLLAVCFVSYCYTDLHLIVRHSLNLWHQLGQGRLLHFYRTATPLAVGALNPQTGEVPYDIWVYLLIAVWNLPVFLWEQLTGLTLDTSVLAILWAKLGLLLPFAGCFWALCGIADTLGAPRRAGWACFAFAGSLFALNGLFCIGQIDVISVFFTLMGLWAWLRRQRRGFLGWFCLAVTCKMFALFVFLPLLLLWEKRPLRILRDTLAACALTLASKLLFFADKMATPTQFDERRFLRFLLANKLTLGEHSLSVFALLFAALLLLCWQARPAEALRPRWGAFALLAGWSCFFLGGATYPYWVVVLAPCAALLLLTDDRGKGELILMLELAAGAGHWLHCLMRYPAVYGGFMNVRWALAGRLRGMQNAGLSFEALLARLSEGAASNLQMLADTALFVGLAGLLLLAWPGRAAGRERRAGQHDPVGEPSAAAQTPAPAETPASPKTPAPAGQRPAAEKPALLINPLFVWLRLGAAAVFGLSGLVLYLL